MYIFAKNTDFYTIFIMFYRFLNTKIKTRDFSYNYEFLFVKNY